MVQRSRIEPESEARSLRKRRAKAPLRPEQIVLRNVVALALLAALVCAALPVVFGPGFLLDRGREAAAFAMAAGEWVRFALAAAFERIPVR